MTGTYKPADGVRPHQVLHDDRCGPSVKKDSAIGIGKPYNVAGGPGNILLRSQSSPDAIILENIRKTS